MSRLPIDRAKSRLPIDRAKNTKRVTWALAELERLLRERAELQKRISSLHKELRALIATSDIPAAERRQLWEINRMFLYASPMQDAIASLLAQSRTPVSPRFLREKLEEIGFSFDGYTNPASVVHKHLSVLVRRALVRQVDRALYEWNTKQAVDTQPAHRVSTRESK